MPKRVSIALTGAVPDHHGFLHVTPNCMSLEGSERGRLALRSRREPLATPVAAFRRGGGERHSIASGLPRVVLGPP